MTICVSVNVAEGLVMAADSAVTLHHSLIDPATGDLKTAVIQTFNYASKVTQILDYPICLLTWGIASINARTIQSLVMEWENKNKKKSDYPGYKVKQIALDIINFISDKYASAYPNYVQGKENSGPLLGLSVGGFETDSFFAKQYEWSFPSCAEPREVRPDLPNGNPNFGANWFGETEALIRLIKGKSQAGLNDLINRGVDPKIAMEWAQAQNADLPLIFDGMPLQDAIDFAKFAIELTIGISRFSQGANTCGGDIDIAVIRPHGVKWHQRKAWSLKDG